MITIFSIHTDNKTLTTNNKMKKKTDKSKTMETKQTIEKALACTVHVCEMILNLTLISFIYTKDQQQFDQCILTTIGKHFEKLYLIALYTSPGVVLLPY